jgi:type II secretory pathway pseudopilin PulG
MSACAGMTKKKTGSLSIEMMAAVGIMAVLISVLAGVGGTFKKVNDQRWVQHTMLAAGQAQMDALAATEKPIDEETFERLWPNVICTVEIADGEGEWKGLEKIQVHLSAKYRQRTLKTSLTRYIPADKESQK